MVGVAPKVLQSGARATGFGLIAHSSTSSSGFFFQNLFAPMGKFLSGTVVPFWKPVLAPVGSFFGNIGNSIGLPTAGKWVAETFGTIMSKEAFNLPILESLGMAASVPVGMFAGVGAAIPVIGLGIKAVTNHVAKKAAARLAAEQAAQAAAKIGGRTIAIAGGALAAGAIGATALSGHPAAAAEMGQNLSRVV